MKLSYEQKRELLRKKLMETRADAWVVDFTDEYLILEEDGKYFQTNYTIENGETHISTDLTEVERKVDFVKVQAAVRISGAQDKGAKDYGYKWRVRIVEFGWDKNNTHWTREPLVAALPMFEGAKVFQLTEAQHQAEGHPFGKPTTELVGWLSGATAESDGIYADLNILKTADHLRNALVDSWERDNPDLLGLSLDLYGATKKMKFGGKEGKYLLSVKNVTVDIVYEPAAGGKFIRMAAARKAGQNKREEDIMDKLLAALKKKRPEAYESVKAKIDEGTITEDEVIELLAAVPAGELEGLDEKIKAAVTEALKAATVDKGGKKEGEPTGDGDGQDGGNDTLKAAQKVLEDARIVACGTILEKELSGSKLPELTQAKLRKQFEKRIFETDELKAAITEEKEYIDKLTGSGRVEGFGDIRMGEDDWDKRVKMVDEFFDGKVHSFKAAYVNLTGDKYVTGRLQASQRLTASIQSTTFAEILGDSVTRRMVKEYNAAGLGDWRKIADVVPLPDFRTNHRTRMGGYGDLPDVAQGAPYNALTSPTDEEATYAPGKKGGTEDVTLETIKNDDAGAIRKIPRKLGRAAARTLHKFVFNFLATNPTIYDTLALFHASHGNLGTVTLAVASLTARRQAVLKQTELDSNEVLGIPAKYLVVPVDLDNTGYDLIATPRNSDFDPTAPDFTRTLQMELIVVPYWTDSNNWFLACDKNDIVCIEVGFLDGKEEPELYVQDMPNVGSMFNNDKLTYKLKHVYGGTVVDYRGLDGSIVP